MRCLLCFCMIMLMCTPVCAEEWCLSTDTSSGDWIARETPGQPVTIRETLAVRAVNSGSTVTQDKFTAYYIGQKESFDIVNVEEAPENPLEGSYSVNSYQVRDREIWGNTRIKYVTKVDPEREATARAMLNDYVQNGPGDGRPFFSNGRMYAIKSDGAGISVTEKNPEESSSNTFYFHRCK